VYIGPVSGKKEKGKEKGKKDGQTVLASTVFQIPFTQIVDKPEWHILGWSVLNSFHQQSGLIVK
jgi:hypothetical protein